MPVSHGLFQPLSRPFLRPLSTLRSDLRRCFSPRLSKRGSSSAVARVKPAVDRAFPLAASSARGANAAESEGSRRAGGGGIGAVCCIGGLESDEERAEQSQRGVLGVSLSLLAERGKKEGTKKEK